MGPWVSVDSDPLSSYKERGGETCSVPGAGHVKTEAQIGAVSCPPVDTKADSREEGGRGRCGAGHSLQREQLLVPTGKKSFPMF